MKCPKCHYLSFEPEPRCRNCGYDLSLADADFDMDWVAEADEPLADLQLRHEADDVESPAPVTAGRMREETPPAPAPATRASKRSAAAPAAAESGSDAGELPLFVKTLKPTARSAQPASKAASQKESRPGAPAAVAAPAAAARPAAARPPVIAPAAPAKAPPAGAPQRAQVASQPQAPAKQAPARTEAPPRADAPPAKAAPARPVGAPAEATPAAPTTAPPPAVKAAPATVAPPPDAAPPVAAPPRADTAARVPAPEAPAAAASAGAALPGPVAAPDEAPGVARSEEPPPASVPAARPSVGARDVSSINVPVEPRPPLSVRRGVGDAHKLQPQEGRPPSRRIGPFDRDLLEDLQRLESEVSGTPIAPARPATGESVVPGLRLAAAAVDAVLLGGVNAIVLWLTLRVCELSLSQAHILPVVPVVAFLALVDVGYLFMFTAASGQTIGKMAFGIRVINGADDGTGDHLSARRAVYRELVALPSVLALGVGFLPALTGEGRALHDRIAHTRVVRA